MLPKSSKHYILPTAEELNINPQLVEDVVAFYYSKLRSALVNLEHFAIKAENLGTFNAKKKELPKLYAKYTNHLSVLKADTFRQMQTKKEVEKKLERVIKLQKLISEESKRKQEFFKKKNDEKNKSGKNLGK
jgi:hypothetical protein